MAEYAFIHIPKNAGTSFNKALKDVPEIDFFGHGVLRRQIKNHKKIYVCRDPIDRFTSAFFYLKNYKKNRENNFFKNPEELLDAYKNIDKRAFEFMRIHDHSHYVYGEEITTDWTFHPQSSWIYDPWRVLIYERLQEEIEDLNNILNINIRLSNYNKSNRSPFEYSEDSINLLKILYKKDFQLYEYYK